MHYSAQHNPTKTVVVYGIGALTLPDIGQLPGAPTPQEAVAKALELTQRI